MKHTKILLVGLILCSLQVQAEEGGILFLGPGEFAPRQELAEYNGWICRNRETSEEALDEYLDLEDRDLLVLATHGIGRCRVDRHFEKNCILRLSLLDPEGYEFEDFPDFYSAKFTDREDETCLAEANGQTKEDLTRTLRLMISMGLCLQ